MNDVKWAPIKGFEGYYEVSDKGDVRRVSTGKNLKQFKNNSGYLRVTLSKGGKVKSYSVHRLVAEAFIPNPQGLKTVNHKNEIKTDNRSDNLEWMTLEENINYGTAQERKQETWKTKRETLLSWCKDPNEIEDISRAQRLAANSRRHYWKQKTT